MSPAWAASERAAPTMAQARATKVVKFDMAGSWRWWGLSALLSQRAGAGASA
jgi:hypothetical protein